MEDAEFLFTISEVSVALAGFAALVTAAGAIGLLGPLVTPIYMVGLCVLLYVSGVLFVALLLSLMQGRGGASPAADKGLQRMRAS